MATKSATIRTITTLYPDTGAAPVCTEDATVTVSDYAEAAEQEIRLSSAAEQQEVTFSSDLCALVITADRPIGVQLNSTSATLLTVRTLTLAAEVGKPALLAGTIYLTGNPSAAANVTIRSISKAT